MYTYRSTAGNQARRRACLPVDTGESSGWSETRPERRRPRSGRRKRGYPGALSLGPGGPIVVSRCSRPRSRFAVGARRWSARYGALEAFFGRALADLPRRRTPVLANAATSTRYVEADAALDDSYLFIQGPPGAGKTYTGSHLIVDLLRGQARRRDVEQPQGDQQPAGGRGVAERGSVPRRQEGRAGTKTIR